MNELDIVSLNRVKKVIESSELAIKRKDIKKILKDFVSSKQIDLAVNYLKDENKIIEGKKGIVWVYNEVKFTSMVTVR